jgi:glycosyltransferase involved in cell wall biosynthesis
MRRVVIIQEHLPHYRVPFFEELYERLKHHNIHLQVICGELNDRRFLGRHLRCVNRVPIKRVGPLAFHCALKQCSHADLIIAPQEVKYVISWWLIFKSSFSTLRFAFWGHGRNFQALDTSCLAERFKRFLSRRVDWWFAYNTLSVQVVRDFGFNSNKITNVRNSIDLKSLISAREAFDMLNLQEFRKQHNLLSDNICVYTGGLYAIKRINFLLKAADKIRTEILDFELVIIGDGPLKHEVDQAVSERPWIHCTGALGDLAKVPYWLISKALLMPGGVGLVILDSFALGIPIVTTETHLHGPEIDYLNDGVNGLMVHCGEDESIYADAVCTLIREPDQLETLRHGALAAASQYSIEDMAQNFMDGVLAALATSPLR